MRDVALTLMSVLLLLTGTAMADIIYVDCNGGGDYLTIQEGIDAAVEGWTVLVEPGTYTGPLNRNLDFGGTNIELRSTAGLSSTIIDCEQIDNAFYFHSGENSNSVVEGFTIRNGWAPWGGGIFCEYSSPTLTNMEFSNNTAVEWGGGVYHGAGSSMTLTSVTFSDNYAWQGGGLGSFASSPSFSQVTFRDNTTDSDGGGLRVLYGSPTLTYVNFLNNHADGNGGAMYCHGALDPGTFLTITHATVTGNTAAGDGGGLLFENSPGPPELTDVHLSKNHAGDSGGALSLIHTAAVMSNLQFHDNTASRGGAVFCQWDERDATINGAFFSGNSADYGGGIYCYYQASPSVQNVAFVGNSAAFEGGGIYCHDGGFPTLDSVVFSENTAEFGGGMACHGSSTAARNLATGTLTIDRTALNFEDRAGPPAGRSAISDSTGSNALDARTWAEPGRNPRPILTLPVRKGDAVSRSGPTRSAAARVSFLDNVADRGGGIYCDDGGVPALDDETFSGNTAEFGGGMICRGSSTAARNLANGTLTIDTTVDVEDTVAPPAEQPSARPGSTGSNALDARTWTEPGGNPRPALAFPAHEGDASIGRGAARTEAVQVSFFDNGADKGGALYCAGNSPSFTNTTFQNNYAMTEGGGLFCTENAHPVITSSIFRSNEAEDGGAVYCHPGDADASLTDTEFLYNQASADGGAIYCGWGCTTVDHALFRGNRAVAGGGVYCAAFWLQSGIQITDAEFILNEADYGGGLYFWYSDLAVLDGIDFVDNNAEYEGGGIYCDGCWSSLTGITFTGNTAARGGGMSCQDSSGPTLTGCVFEGNNVIYGGGGVQCTGNSSPTITETTFRLNAAKYGGGMVSKANSSPTLSDVVFEDNSALWTGGMRCEGGTAVLDHVVFSGNAATSSGGGMAGVQGAQPHLSYTTFFGNTAGRGGGYISASDATFSNCTFASNSGDPGGGIYCTGSSATPDLQNTIVAFSAEGEGVACANGANPTITHCSVYGNEGGDDLCGTHYDNLFEDPLFCDLEAGDLTLHDSSPCLPGGNPWGELIGAYGAGGCGRGVADAEQAEATGVEFPERFYLYPPAPNPFSGVTTIEYQIPDDGANLSIAIYNTSGQLIRTVADDPREAGRSQFVWSGRDEQGRQVASGVYFCRAVLDSDEMWRKVILIR